MCSFLQPDTSAAPSLEGTSSAMPISPPQVMAIEYTKGDVFLGLWYKDRTFTFCSKPIEKIKKEVFKLNVCPKSMEISKQKYDIHVTGLKEEYIINSYRIVKCINGKLEYPACFIDILKDGVFDYIRWNK